MESLDLQSNTPSQPSMDADPLIPRAEIHTNNAENEPSVLDFPEPPKDWQFNIFLDRLSDEITSDEFKKAKDLFTGIIGKKVIEECTTVTDVFKIMRQRTFLSPDNLLYLQSIIFRLRRHDLLQMCVEYARDINDVMHFYTPPDTAADGYKMTRFHVEGKDYSNFSRQYVEKLRRTVANILFVPLHNVFIAGVEPSSSMLITLMIPDMYADMLETMLNDNVTMDELTEIGIDVIGLTGKQYNIRVSEIEEAEILLTDQQTKLVNVYQQLQTKTKQLEEREVECLILSKKLKKFENGDLAKDAVLRTFQLMFTSVMPETISASRKTPASLGSQTALFKFKNTLKHVESKGYDRDLILALLHTNTQVTETRLRDAFNFQFRRMCIEIEDLQSQVTPLSLELHKYKFLLQVDSGQVDELILGSLLNAILRNIATEVNISMMMHYIEASKKASKLLRQKEKMKLKQQYQWLKSEPLTDIIEKESSLFLSCIYVKEVQTKGKDLDPVEFHTKCLDEVGRKDLVVKFQSWIKSPSTLAGQKRTKGTPMPSSRRDTSRSRKEGHHEQETDSLSEKVNAIEKKVDSILKVMESAQEKPPSYASLGSDMFSLYPDKRYPFYRQSLHDEKQAE